MYEHLETAEQTENLKRVVVDPVSRVEGHGKVTLLLDENNKVQQARLHIVEFRGFERFIQGRPYWELPVLVQRLCGICPVSHHLAAAKAIDQLVGIDPENLPVSADKLRRLLHFGQVMQSHALHFFHLSSPDLLFGFESDIGKRNIIAVLTDYPDIGLQGVKLRKYGQEVIRMVSGKRIHGTGAIAGGMNKSLTKVERDYLLEDIDQMITWAADSVALIKKVHCSNLPYYDDFATIRTNYLGLTKPDGALELYHGGIRAKNVEGETILDHFDYCRYNDIIHEEVRSWTYMKFPYLLSLGKEDGWYRVGPLARVNNCDYINTPLAEAARVEFKEHTGEAMVHSTLAFHWTRLIEVLHCAESIKELLHDPDIMGHDLVAQGERRFEGIGVIEAPRGTLFHHYQVDENDIVTKANLIVSTTSNNMAMNESVRQVAAEYLSGRELTEPLLNNLEVAIRAYDPCLSCATHAVGKMPLQLELVDAKGQLIDKLIKHSDGQIDRLDG
ncbi:MAG: Ni/Fe hydrogenase subunit alpha [Methylococcaceae bacterium]|nr:Ni/Fe hydrogenase subunit alpha [Methylococcaceae bacterium]MDZ4155130.1 Ni/Fe hydrogenase subunit alpha [Methylococcales bacterium]MDP2394426.1 Ni/Fe hydrogenase subunit alpha [Methylococcaceae bacterium]MDP3021469.1 Ni/Fe hydrogenase subunit alpha [Methylococcaceae bacterium]MDP3390412.1 Ni/Fe hydrogenase subunit alpha [Methylococcaceae bacterium]